MNLLEKLAEEKRAGADPGIEMRVQEPVARARTTDPDTSHAAAASVTEIRKSQQAVLDCLRASGPLTDEQLIAAYGRAWVERGWPRQSMSGIRSRRSELVNMQPPLVVDTGEKERMVTGRLAKVWAAAV